MPDSAQPPSPEWNAKLRQIIISPGHDYWGKQGEGRLQHGFTSPQEVECVAGMGLRGDRYFGVRPDYKGQVTFLDAAVVDEVRRVFQVAKLPASVFRRNLIVAGVNLAAWKNRRFRFQDIEFEGSQECTPCDWMDRVIGPGAREFLKETFRGGLRAKVMSSGHAARHFLTAVPDPGSHSWRRRSKYSSAARHPSDWWSLPEG